MWKALPKIVNHQGETGYNSYSQGLEHQEGLRNEHEVSPLWKHCTLEHGGEKVNFTITILKSFRSFFKQLLKLMQVNEAVRIGSSQVDVLLNSKSEFHQAPLTRVLAFSGLHGDQGEDQTGQVFSLVGAWERQGHKDIDCLI